MVRTVDGIRCHYCGGNVRNDPEQCDNGWRIVCQNCHHDFIVVEYPA
jgi:hypothetical protein